jgi:hypothetical protein
VEQCPQETSCKLCEKNVYIKLAEAVSMRCEEKLSAMPNQGDGATTKSVRPAHVLSVDTDRDSMQEAFQVKMPYPPERGAQQLTSNSTSCAVEPVRNGLNLQQTGLKLIITAGNWHSLLLQHRSILDHQQPSAICPRMH